MVLQPVVDFIQQELGGKISKASVSARLTDSPCILVTSQQGWSANMQRIMKSQPMGDNRAMDYMKGEKIMEINPDNQVCLWMYFHHNWLRFIVTALAIVLWPDNMQVSGSCRALDP